MENTCSSLNVIFSDTHYNINYSKNMSYSEFSSNILNKITNINITNNIFKQKFAEQFNNEYYIVWISKILTKENWSSINNFISPGDTIFIMNKLKGGIEIDIFEPLFALLKPITQPITHIFNAVIEGVVIIKDLLELLFNAIELIPLIFDPAKLIDDIMFGITYGINTAMGGVMGSIDPKKPEEEKQTSGLFDVNTKKDTSTVCISPSLSVILLLILCPPLAIFYKYSFIKAIIPSIICGVLCVKLYYFPGLLFATLMVLC